MRGSGSCSSSSRSFCNRSPGYSALESGLTVVPVTLVMFALSKRFGALADRFGPRLFMGAGPLIGAVGILLLLRTGLETDYMTDLLPALLVFSLGLSLTVAPLVATVLADADESDAGIASAINNAVARVAGLVGVVGLWGWSSRARSLVTPSRERRIGGSIPRRRRDLRGSRGRRRRARGGRHRQSAGSDRSRGCALGANSSGRRSEQRSATSRASATIVEPMPREA